MHCYNWCQKKQILLYICKHVQPTDKEMRVNEELTKNEMYAIQYLAGYIFHKFYNEFKQQLKNNETYIHAVLQYFISW